MWIRMLFHNQFERSFLLCVAWKETLQGLFLYVSLEEEHSCARPAWEAQGFLAPAQAASSTRVTALLRGEKTKASLVLVGAWSCV